MAPMPITDALFLLAEARERPMHVGGLQLFKPPPDAGAHEVGRRYQEAIDAEQVRSRLRLRPVSMLPLVGPWAWRADDHLDLEYHVRHSALPHPGRVRELLALVSRLHGTLLDRSRPLWEMHLIEGLADGRFATYHKVHHALMDGVTAMRLLDRSLSDDPDARGMPPPFASAQPSAAPGGASARRSIEQAASMAAEAARGALAAAEAAAATVATAVSDQAAALPYQAPPSPLNVPITGARRFAADSWPLARLTAVAEHADATLNDVVLAMCGGALRRYLAASDGLPDRPLVAMVPVSLRPGGAASGVDPDGQADDPAAGGNAVGLVLCNLATHLPHAEQRFEVTRRSMGLAKAQLRDLPGPGALMLSAISFAPLAFGPLFKRTPLRKPPFNLIISNVPGPRQRRWWNGAELDGHYPASIPIDGQALNITVSSYADRMGFGLTGCRRSVPQLQRLLDDLEHALGELEEAVADGAGDEAR